MRRRWQTCVPLTDVQAVFGLQKSMRGAACGRSTTRRPGVFVDGAGTTSHVTGMLYQSQGTWIVFDPVQSFAHGILKRGDTGRIVGPGLCEHTGRAAGNPPALHGGDGFAPTRKTRPPTERVILGPRYA